MIPPRTVLVADDNAPFRRLVRLTLERAGYAMTEAADGAAADRQVTERQPDLVVLDVVMPYVSGLDLVRRWRSRSLNMGVIVLTGGRDRQSVGDLLEAGADDHIVKPFQPRELVQRVNAVLRRIRGPDTDPTEIVVGSVRLDLTRQVALVDERVVRLTRTEMGLLRELMTSPNRVLSPAELLASVWGPEYRGDAEILRTNIYRLRRKLNTADFLQSRSGLGYYVAAPDAAQPPA